MAITPRQRLARPLDHLDDAVADGSIDTETADWFRELVDVLDVGKPYRTATDVDGRVFQCKPTLLEMNLRSLGVMAESGVDFVPAGPESVNEYMTVGTTASDPSTTAASVLVPPPSMPSRLLIAGRLGYRLRGGCDSGFVPRYLRRPCSG